APELFEGQVSRGCDTFSLAVIWQELLTGIHPYRGQSMQPQALARSKARPDLSGLPHADRGIIARALERDPQQRWGSCTELVRALEAATHQDDDDTHVQNVAAHLTTDPNLTPLPAAP